MGYYTYYDVSFKNEHKTSEYAKKLAEINPNYFGQSYNSLSYKTLEGMISRDSMTWYDHDRDMMKLSKAFPDETFVLYGEGEEKGDLWKGYYKNGKMEICRAQIIYPEPDSFFS